MLHDIEEALGALKKNSYVDYVHNLQGPNAALISKFSKREEWYANLEKQFVNEF